MAKARKILEKALSGSKNIRFGDFVRLAEAFGFVLDRIRGSHHIFRHPDVPALLNLQPSRDGKVKPYQIRQLLALVEEYELRIDSTEGEEDAQ